MGVHGRDTSEKRVQVGNDQGKSHSVRNSHSDNHIQSKYVTFISCSSHIYFQVAPKIKEGMVKEGSLLIGYTPLKQKGFVNFFRIIVQNNLCEHSDMDYVIQEIDRLGRDLNV